MTKANPAICIVWQALDHVPDTVIHGVEPEDIDTLSTELTATTQAKSTPLSRRYLVR